MLALVPGYVDPDKITSGMDAFLQKDSEYLGFKVSASYGVTTTVFDKSLNMDKIIGRADEQMYQMKKRNK